MWSLVQAVFENLLGKEMTPPRLIPHNLTAEEDDDDTTTSYRGARAAPPRACAIVDPCSGEWDMSVVWMFLTPSVRLSFLFRLSLITPRILQ
jgi:hypothetical protein